MDTKINVTKQRILLQQNLCIILCNYLPEFTRHSFRGKCSDQPQCVNRRFLGLSSHIQRILEHSNTWMSTTAFSNLQILGPSAKYLQPSQNLKALTKITYWFVYNSNLNCRQMDLQPKKFAVTQQFDLHMLIFSNSVPDYNFFLPPAIILLSTPRIVETSNPHKICKIIPGE